MKKIAHITDIHLEEQFSIDNGVKAKENLRIILNDVVERNIEEIVFTGDIGTKESNEWLFDSFKKYNLNFKVTLGNHDSFAEAIKFYNPGLLKERSELFYTSEGEYFKYLFLDTSSSEISQSQLSWLQNELNTDKKIIMFVHHPILETNTTPQREYPLIGNDKINSKLQKFGKDVYIFCGHLHMDDEHSEGNVKQFVTPAVSFQAKKYSETSEKDNLNFGYRIVTITKDEVLSEIKMFAPIQNKF